MHWHPDRFEAARFNRLREERDRQGRVGHDEIQGYLHGVPRADGDRWGGGLTRLAAALLRALRGNGVTTSLSREWVLRARSADPEAGQMIAGP